MVEILVTCIQTMCLAAYLYGACVVISHAAGLRMPEGDNGRYAPGADGEDRAAWQRYLAYDQ